MVLSEILYLRRMASGLLGRLGRALPLATLTEEELLPPKEPTLLEELWAYFEGKYFSVDLGRYQHISVQSNQLVNLRNLILGMCGGMIVASAMMAFEKNKKGAFVRKLIKNQCLWPEKAATLAELGYKKSFAIKGDLCRTTALSKTVHCVEREAHEQAVEAKRAAYVELHGSDEGFVAPAFHMDFETAHFYIPDEKHYAADIRYDNKGSSWRMLVLVSVIAVVLASLVCFLLPEMLQLVDNMIGIFKAE